jgi:hypothetical protein
MFMKTKLYKFPPTLRRFYRLEKYQYFNETTKEYMMFNTKVSIGIAVAGFAVQVFTYFCSAQLNAQTLANFNLISSIAMFVAFISFALNTTSAVEDMRKDVNNNNDDVRRDFDAVYRYVDDLNRDLGREIEDACRRSKK